MKKILIVEDDPAIAQGLNDYLVAKNFDVLIRQDGMEGLNNANVTMVSKDPEFVNPIIIITSNVEETDEIVGLEIGADDYIKKPFVLREVLARVRANLRQFERNASLGESRNHKNEEFHRNLMCVMFTDIKDYSKKMHEDELLTIKLLQIHNEIVNQVIKKYNGKIIEIVGDAFVVSFNSAVEGVSCGVAIQKEFNKYNNLKSPKENIEIRIGIHLGDLIEFEGKYKGDAMNIAARIEQNAKESEVWMSESV